MVQARRGAPHSGIALMLAALFLGYRSDGLPERVILCGPGVIVGFFGYALIEKYHRDV